MARARSLLLLGFLLIGPAGCSDEPPARPTPPSILLITLDTVRADRLGSYGNRDGLTPFLDQLARDGVVFEQAIAPTPITLPSHASILTGVLPPQHGVRDNTFFTLQPEAQLVSEALKRAGWRTAAFVGALMLDRRYGLGQGFEHYTGPSRQDGETTETASANTPKRVAPWTAYSERPANNVVSDALDWIQGIESYERFFIWLHLYDPHTPYAPPEPWKSRFEHPYDAEIAFCDDQLRRLLESLKESGHANNLLTVVTSDHGQGLNEHDEPTHGLFLYQSTLSVPLLFHGGPVTAAAGTRISQPVSTADIAASLVALAQLPADALHEAHSPALFAPTGEPLAPSEDRAIYVESLLPYHAYRWSAWRGLVWRGYKLIAGRSTQLFALGPDPGEEFDLAERERERLGLMQARLQETIASYTELGWNGSRTTERGEEEMLQSLGYVAGSVGDDPFAPDLPDPRLRAGDLPHYGTSFSLLVRAQKILPKDPAKRALMSPDRLERGLGRARRAETILDELWQQDPGNPHVAMRLGSAKHLLGKHAEAIPLFEQASRAYPQDESLHDQIASCKHAVRQALAN